MKKLIQLFVLALAMMACNTDDMTSIENSDFVGKWNWTITAGGLIFIEETPETTGKTRVLTLEKNYTFSITENGNEISSGTYVLTLKESIYSNKIEKFIQFPENSQYTGIVNAGIIKTYDSNKLDISDNIYDGVGSGFIRIE